MSKKKNIVVIGGGTGTFTVLSGLKKYPLNISAIVSMADSGGSNKVIRDELGLLPTSDIRQCFVALAKESNQTERLLRSLFMYRFDKGNGLKGMTFGNLFLAALSDILGSQDEAIEKTSQVLKVKGRVLPVTLSNSNLVAVYEDGERVVGEHFIDEPDRDRKVKIQKLSLEPISKANPKAIEAIMEADIVVIGPGDLYTSLIVNLLVKGVVKALQKTKAKIVYIMNLMTRHGQTTGFPAKDHIFALEKYLGKNQLDFVLVNSEKIPDKIIKKYEKEENSIAVKDDLEGGSFKIIRGDFLNKKEVKKSSADSLKRSLIRHDSDKLAKSLAKLAKCFVN